MITHYDRLLSDAECADLERFLPAKDWVKFMGKHAEMEEYIVTRVLPRISEAGAPSYHSCGLVSINIDTEPVIFHLDNQQSDETHKMLIYLTEGAGTDFCNPGGVPVLSVDGHRGSVVIFDIRMYHAGRPFLDEQMIKKTCGLY